LYWLPVTTTNSEIISLQREKVTFITVSEVSFRGVFGPCLGPVLRQHSMARTRASTEPLLLSQETKRERQTDTGTERCTHTPAQKFKGKTSAW
jgi:hypothetical protein